MTKDSDPLGVNDRLYKQLAMLLDDMEAADREERMTMPQRISAMVAIGRVLKMFQDLKKGEFSLGGGSSIDKYAAAFAPTDAARRGADDARFGELDRERDDDDTRDEFDA